MLRPYRWRLFGLGLLLGALAIVNLAVPFAIKLVLDRVFPGPDRAGEWSVMLWILPGLGVVFLVRAWLTYQHRMVAVRIGEDAVHRMRSEVFGCLQRMHMNYLRAEQAGRVASRVMDDTSRVLLFLQEHLPKLGLFAISAVVLTIVIFAVNWMLAIASVVVLPLLVLTYRYFIGPIRTSHAVAQEHLAQAQGSLVERLLGIAVVQGFMAESREQRRFDSSLNSVRRAYIRSQRFHMLQKGAADLLIGVGVLLLLGFGAWQVLDGVMTTGEFVMFFGYVTMLYPAVVEALNESSHLARARASAVRVGEVLASDEAFWNEGGRDNTISEVKGVLRFEHVGFAYPDGTEILRDVDFTITPGERVALIGASGAGKTTLSSLMLRFQEPTTGRILLDNRPLTQWPLGHVRSQIAVAFEDVFLFNCSLLENVLYGRPTAEVDEIIEACRLTGAHEFIDRLPHGYGSTPDALGGRFSRGQKQRVALARTVLRRPRILVMDEATSSLDPESAGEVIGRVVAALPDSTIILITHDPTLAALMDRQIELTADGVSVESARQHS
jgi:subfamily B ATP-binding cassette protein MsbA